MQKQKVFIVGGGGMVGATAAYALALQEIIEEIVLIDVNEALVWGQAADINDAMGLDSNILVRTGSYDEIDDNDIVVITAGAAQKPGQTRMDLLSVNADIVRQIAQKVASNGRQPYIVMVSNPVDVLTYVALKESGLPKSRVLGTGTTLDTSRLRTIIADSLRVDSGEVDAYILGEHGDSSFSTIESAQVGDIPLTSYPEFNPATVENVDQITREKAYKIIESKKSTYYAIGQVVAKIVDALLNSSSSIFPVCSLAEGEYGLHDVVIGLPSKVSSDGVVILEGYQLSDNERQSLDRSSEVIKQAIASL